MNCCQGASKIDVELELMHGRCYMQDGDKENTDSNTGPDAEPVSMALA
jgi:hypothetical protein